VAAACRAAGPTSAPPDDGATNVTADAVECRQVAHDRVQNLPAVRSGQTTYIPGGPAPYYQACMKERGYDTYPPY
jgi:hypothetical protein